MTEDHRCFWHGQQFKIGDNKTIDEFGYSLTLDKPSDLNGFAVTGEDILPDENSICCHVKYLSEDVVGTSHLSTINVKKFYLLDELPLAKGLIPSPGIHFQLTKDIIQKYPEHTYEEMSILYLKKICPKLRKEGIKIIADFDLKDYIRSNIIHERN